MEIKTAIEIIAQLRKIYKNFGADIVEINKFLSRLRFLDYSNLKHSSKDLEKIIKYTSQYNNFKKFVGRINDKKVAVYLNGLRSERDRNKIHPKTAAIYNQKSQKKIYSGYSWQDFIDRPLSDKQFEHADKWLRNWGRFKKTETGYVRGKKNLIEIVKIVKKNIIVLKIKTGQTGQS